MRNETLGCERSHLSDNVFKIYSRTLLTLTWCAAEGTGVGKRRQEIDETVELLSPLCVSKSKHKRNIKKM